MTITREPTVFSHPQLMHALPAARDTHLRAAAARARWVGALRRHASTIDRVPAAAPGRCWWPRHSQAALS